MPKIATPLSAFDLRVLRERTVSVETALRNRLRTENGALVIPFADLDGEFNCYALRRPHAPPVWDGKPLKYLAPAGVPARAYFPAESRAGLREPGTAVLITEGPIKALALAERGYAAIGITGVWTWKVKGSEDLAPELAAIRWAGRDVYIVFDFDPKEKTRRNVDLARRRFARALRKAGARTVCTIELPPGRDGAKNGVDDFLAAAGDDAFRALVGAARPVPDRTPVRVSTREDEVNDAAAAALADDPEVFERGGVLVHVVRADGNDSAAGLHRPAGAPRIVPLPPALLRERLAANVDFVRFDANKESDVSAHPPAWCVNAVHARGRWPRVRPLAGVTDVPVLRRDGTVLSEPGYDPATGLLFLPAAAIPSVPEQPTAADVAAAVALLTDLTCDFPFERPAHQSAWLAYLLTPLARHAFDGPAPLTLFDGNVRGAGKGLLCGLVAIVATGRHMPVTAACAGDDEMRKAVTAAAIAGDPLIVLDNVAGGLGGPTLDAVLTSTRWRDRLLGSSAIIDLPMTATWAATGNNVVLRGDMARRVNVVRLNSPHEHPEDRTGFRHPDLKGYARKYRGELLAAGLTILRGYCAAGRPDPGLTPWGSFEGWSGLVRSSVVWAGLPDPGAARTEVRKTSDPEAAALPALLAGLAALDPEGSGLTVNEVIVKCEFAKDPALKALWEALGVLCPGRGGDAVAGARSVGMKFHYLRGRVVGGRYLERIDSPSHGVGTRWRVAGTGPEGTRGSEGTTPGPFAIAPESNSASEPAVRGGGKGESQFEAWKRAQASRR